MKENHVFSLESNTDVGKGFTVNLISRENKTSACNL